MSDLVLRVAVDLAGSLEPMGDTMNDLAVSLTDRGIDVVPFASARGRHRISPQRTFMAPITQLWRHGYGPAIDRFLPRVDVIHVAGRQIPPTNRTPLVVSVDDLRPFIDNDDNARVEQLQLAVVRGAMVVATSYAARRRVVRALDVEASDVAVAFPAVPRLAPPHTLRHVVVSVTGVVDHFLSMAPEIVRHARDLQLTVVALASKEAGTKIRAHAPEVIVAPRRNARQLLGEAHTVIHLSDGARFPSLPIAAIGCGLPVVATSTDVNRELLEGCVDLISEDDVAGAMSIIVRTMTDETHRGLLGSAGRTRALDFTPDVAARRYEGLYRDAVASWSR
jgi:hypothetical protein